MKVHDLGGGINGNITEDVKMRAIRSMYHLYRLKRRLLWPRHNLEVLRRKKLSRLLKYCYRHVPYYTELFKKMGAEPEDFVSLEHLADFPIVEKETLRDRIDEFIDSRVNRRSLISYSSSGSTGIPLTLWYDPEERRRMGYTITRTFLHHGLRPWHRMINITEPRHFSVKDQWYHRLGLMNEQFLSIFDKPEDNLKLLRKIKPDLLIGFPSILTLIGRMMSTQKSAPLRPRFLYTIAEVLTSDYREILHEQWGIDPIDLYGANESGIMAFQCTRRAGYHVNIDSVHIDIVNGDRTCDVGERGEVVVTSLDLRVMPIIRYRVGDISYRMKGNCACECNFPCLGEIVGRSDGFVIGTSGKMFSALEVSLLLHPIKGIQHYRLIQEKKGYVRIEWVAKEGAYRADNEIRSVLQRCLGEDFEIDVHRIDQIQREKSGKIRSVISNVTPYIR